MKSAILDLGTNTFHLLIAERNQDKFEILYKTNRPIKLGENITKEDKIIPEAFERALSCLIDFKSKIDEFAVSEIKAMATSAVRSAKNGKEFIATVKAKTGIEIDIIDGEKEAEYIYQGVKLSGAIQGKSLITDIGGGSTEFILCDEKEVFWKQSFNIGASRLMQKFFHSDPLSLDDQTAIEQHLELELRPLKEQIQAFRPEILIGSAGAFETYAEMLDRSFSLESPSGSIDLEAFEKLANQLIKSTHQEREQMDKLIALRVDMIVMATVQTNFILGLTDFKKLMVSTYDLKMGVLACLH